MSKVYEAINNKVIDIINKNPDLTWYKLFASKAPRNAFTQREYNGINHLLLYIDANTNEQSGQYATFRQVNDNGGRIKKGSKAKTVVFWQSIQTKKNVDDENEKPKKGLVLRFWGVFSVEDIEGIDWSKYDKTNNDNKTIVSCEDIVNNYITREILAVKTNELIKAPLYANPPHDFIEVPDLKQYKNSNAYYADLFHELVHSTGADSRLKRNLSHGEEEYAKEELIAEIGAAYLMVKAGLEPDIVNTSAYIKNWLKPLEDNQMFLIQAFSKAEKAVKYILEGKKK